MNPNQNPFNRALVLKETDNQDSVVLPILNVKEVCQSDDGHAVITDGFGKIHHIEGDILGLARKILFCAQSLREETIMMQAEIHCLKNGLPFDPSEWDDGDSRQNLIERYECGESPAMTGDLGKQQS